MTKTLKISLTGGVTYEWIESGSGTDEYYLQLVGGGDPAIAAEPGRLLENGTALVAGTVGSLAAGEWDWGNNDSLGFSTVYVCLTTGGPDPDTLTWQSLVAEVTTTIADSNNEVFDGILLVDTFPLVPKTIVTSTFTKLLDANGARRLVQLTNESGGDIYIAFQAAAPSDTTTMRLMATTETVWYSALDGMPSANLWAYHTQGSDKVLKVAEGSS